MPQYIAQMWLEYTPESDDATHVDAAAQKFNDIWPDNGRWDTIVVNASALADLLTILGAEFRTRLRDVSPWPYWASVSLRDPFASIIWYRGSNGLHQTQRSQVTLADGTLVTFPYMVGSVEHDADLFVCAKSRMTEWTKLP